MCLRSIPNKSRKKHGKRVWRLLSLQLANERYENGDGGRSRVRDRDFSSVDSIWLSSPADAYLAYAEFLRHPDNFDLLRRGVPITFGQQSGRAGERTC